MSTTTPPLGSIFFNCPMGRLATLRQLQRLLYLSLSVDTTFIKRNHRNKLLDLARALTSSSGHVSRGKDQDQDSLGEEYH